MWTKEFWQGTAERLVKTGAQAAAAMLTGDGLGILDVDWADVGSVSALAMVGSLLTSLISYKIGPTQSPSMVEDQP